MEEIKDCNLATIESKVALRQGKTKIKIDESTAPILSAKMQSEIEAVLAQFEKAKTWKAWGLDTIRKQGAMLLLEGPPGTGKTITAEYLAKRVGRSLVTLNMKDVGGKAPGHTERMVNEVFTTARNQGTKTILLDECEAILWDRGRAGSDSMWMVGVIDELLMQIAKYPGLMIAATNRIDIIDPALKDRCFAVLQLALPEFPERVRLWQQKIPARFPLQLTHIQREELASVVMSGRQIVNAIVREASLALDANRLPRYEDLLNLVKQMAA